MASVANGPAPSVAKRHHQLCGTGDLESCAGFRFCGSKSVDWWKPHRADVLTELRRSTVARVCTGRAGPRPRTQALLRFRPITRSPKDTVLKEVPEEGSAGLAGSPLEISDKKFYRLVRIWAAACAEAVALKAQCVANPDVQVVILMACQLMRSP